MARANRHYIPGQVWHLTHRCHKKEYLLKFSKDRQQWMKNLYAVKKKFGLVILDYMVTSNHTHLLVYDKDGVGVIPKSIQFLAGRTAQDYNNRKGRFGAFWQDRYHATAVETGEHLKKCLVYIDLNMVRANIVDHPSQWKWCGYNEIQNPRRKNVIIDYEKLFELSGFETYGVFQSAHKQWIDYTLTNDELKRESHWTQSIATGSKSFVQEIHSKLGIRARGKQIVETSDGYQVCEEISSYNAFFDTEKGNIEGENCLFWDDNC
jgi:putative transposase